MVICAPFSFSCFVYLSSIYRSMYQSSIFTYVSFLLSIQYQLLDSFPSKIFHPKQLHQNFTSMQWADSQIWILHQHMQSRSTAQHAKGPIILLASTILVSYCCIKKKNPQIYWLSITISIYLFHGLGLAGVSLVVPLSHLVWQSSGGSVITWLAVGAGSLLGAELDKLRPPPCGLSTCLGFS